MFPHMIAVAQWFPPLEWLPTRSSSLPIPFLVDFLIQVASLRIPCGSEAAQTAAAAAAAEVAAAAAALGQLQTTSQWRREEGK